MTVAGRAPARLTEHHWQFQNVVDYDYGYAGVSECPCVSPLHMSGKSGDSFSVPLGTHRAISRAPSQAISKSLPTLTQCYRTLKPLRSDSGSS